MELLLRQIRANILELKFEEAAEALSQALTQGIMLHELAPLAFQLAFVYLHAGKISLGSNLLFQTVESFAGAGQPVPPFPHPSFPHGYDSLELLEFLRQSNPTFFTQLEHRYFPVMRQIEGGKFDMGDVLGDDIFKDEIVHLVHLTDFELAETPITWQQYGLYCLANNLELPKDNGWGRGDRPVIDVNWHNANSYAVWLSEHMGLTAAITTQVDGTPLLNLKANGYRLPTEAEWEYAARERGRIVRFGNGKNEANSKEMNFEASKHFVTEYSLAGSYRRQTTLVREFEANCLGLYDMSGNVWEWCWDKYDANYHITNQPLNPMGPTDGHTRVGRGGSWSSLPQYCRVSVRDHDLPDFRRYNLGFRLARTP